MKRAPRQAVVMAALMVGLMLGWSGRAAAQVTPGATPGAASGTTPGTAAAVPEGGNESRNRQQQAYDLTRELLTNALDVQVLQLEENKLTDLPLYEDLKAMRGRVAELAEQAMPEVLALMNQAAAAANPADARKLQAAIQGRMQQVLVRLLAEREKLRLRRKQAELIDRVNELLAAQKATLATTESLTPGSGDAAVLAAVGAQGTVGTLFSTFEKMVADMSGWPGEFGAAAAQSQRMIRKDQVAQALKAADDHLGAARFDKATASQKAVVAALEKVLAELRKLRDPLAAGAEPIEAVRLIIRQQERNRERTRKINFPAEKPDALVQDQNDIQGKILRLGTALPADDRIAGLIQRAAAAASTAAEALFDADKPAALDQQGRTIGALSLLEKELADRTARNNGPKSAQELEAQAQRLAEVKAKLEKALATERESAQAAKTGSPDATKKMEETRQTLQDAGKTPGLPPAPESRIHNAEQEAQDAAKEMQQKAAPQAADKTDLAIRQAIGEVNEALAQTKREALAVKLGELNRAAESLSRAAAAARESAEDLKKGPKEAADAKEKLDKVQQITDEVAKGTKDTAPEAAPTLKDAADLGKQIAKDLLPKATQPSGREARKDAADKSQDLARKLDDAADKLRDEMGKTADKLEKEAGAELAKTDKLKDDLQKLAERQPPAAPDELRKMGDDALEHTPAVGADLREAAEARAQADKDAAHDPNKANPDKPNPDQQKPDNKPNPDQKNPDQKTPDQKNPDQKNPGQKNPDADKKNPPAPDAAEQPKDEDQSDAAKDLADRALERSRTHAEIKSDNLAQDVDLARRMKELAKAQREADKDIADARKDIEKRPDDQPPKDDDPAGKKLDEAMTKMADAMRDAGKNVEDKTGQKDLANKPIKNAAEIASTLKGPEEKGKPEPGEPDAKNPEGQQDPGQDKTGQPNPDDAQGPKAPGQEDPQNPNGPNNGQKKPPEDGGTTPQDPEKTAQMMAGEKGAKLAEAARKNGQPQAHDDKDKGNGQDEPDSNRLGQIEQKADIESAKATRGQGQIGTGMRGGDAVNVPATRPPGSWSAGLPAAVVESMKSIGKQTPPPGYEDRLKNYFEGGE